MKTNLPSQKLISTSIATSLLQRKCACGNSAGLTGECAACQTEKLTLQRKQTTTQEDISEVPPTVYEVLNAPGQPLDLDTRILMESRFGYDFSKVRVHTDAKAAESAQAVSALAYTVKPEIVFGIGQYEPQTRKGQELLAHELTHILQQQSDAPRHPQAKLTINSPGDASEREADRVNTIVSQQKKHGYLNPIKNKLQRRTIFEGIAGLFSGDSFKEKELQDYLTTLDKTGKIEDFTDSDNKARAIVNAWKQGGSPYNLTVQRKTLLIQEMQSGFTGNDDEQAILEILERSSNSELSEIFTNGVKIKELNSDFQGDEWEQLQDFYERRFEGSLSALTKGEVKPIGVPLTFGATRMEESLYDQKLKEANDRLSGVQFGSTGGLQLENYCLPESKENSSSKTSIYWYDKDFWEPDIDEPKDKSTPKSCKLKLLNGKSASAAIDALFDHQGKWKVDCAQFVQIFHLYALRHTLGTTKFDQKYQEGVTLELKRRGSTGVETKILYSRNASSQPMKRSTDHQEEPTPVERLLIEAPVGSRVRWSNTDSKAFGTAWEHENTVKLGLNRYAAHPLYKSKWIFGKDYILTRNEIELKVAQEVNKDADEAYIKKHIFISEIEYFKRPDE